MLLLNLASALELHKNIRDSLTGSEVLNPQLPTTRAPGDNRILSLYAIRVSRLQRRHHWYVTRQSDPISTWTQVKASASGGQVYLSMSATFFVTPPAPCSRVNKGEAPVCIVSLRQLVDLGDVFISKYRPLRLWQLCGLGTSVVWRHRLP